MNASEYCSLLLDAGFALRKIDDGYTWMLRDDHTAICVPSLESVNPKKEELTKVMSVRHPVAVFMSDADIPPNSVEYIINTNDYSLNIFNSKTRNQIRKGLKSCTLVRPNLCDLITMGHQINLDTLARQSRSASYLIKPKLWEKYISSLYKSPDVKILGAFVESNLIAYIVAVNINGKYYIYHPFMMRRFSNLCPMNALLYQLVNDIIATDGSALVSYGLGSFSALPGLDNFKSNMCFVALPCRRIVAMHPILKIFATKLVCHLAIFLHKFRLLPSKFLRHIIFLNDSSRYFDSYLKAISKLA